MKALIPFTLLALCLSQSARAQESEDTIRLALNDWSSQQIITQITAKLLEKMSYKVELVTAGYYPQMAALESGDIAATMEVWSDNVPESFAAQVKEGKVKIVSSIGFEGTVGWWYPASFEKTCPGLPDYKALLKCQDQLVTEDTYPKPRFVEYPKDWGNTNNLERIKAFGFDFDVVSAGSGGALAAELKSAQASGEPLVIQFYTPNVSLTEVDFKLVKMPDYTPECASDPAWGINKTATYDCAFPHSEIYKVAWPGMGEKWPKAYKLIEQVSFSLEQDLAFMKANEVDGVAQDKIVDEWLSKNETVWKDWIAKASK